MQGDLVVRIGDGADVAREDFLRIYEASFPAWERAPVSELWEPGATLICVAESGSRLVGLATGHRLPDVAMFYLEFLAVDPQRRDGGIGGRLLQFLCAQAAEQGDTAVVFEIECVTAQASDAARRRAFYRRHGAVEISEASGYIVPRFDREGFEPMTMMWLPLSQTQAPPTGEALREVIASIFRNGYGYDSHQAQQHAARILG